MDTMPNATEQTSMLNASPHPRPECRSEHIEMTTTTQRHQSARPRGTSEFKNETKNQEKRRKKPQQKYGALNRNIKRLNN